MSRLKVRYFVEKPGAAGKGPRYFWQPKASLRDMGWEPERLPDDRGQAITRADRLNEELDAWRKGQTLPPLAAASPAAPAPAQARGAKIVKPGSVAYLIRLYKKSRFYLKLSDKTTKGYDQNLDVIEDWAGDMPIGAVGKARVEIFYESMRPRTPSKANAVIGMLRILLEFAKRMELVKENAAASPGMIGTPFAGKLWPIDAVSLFVETADLMKLHSLGTAVVINHWLGQREGDILELKRTAWRNGRFHIEQNKGGARVSIPHSPWVAERVETELKRQGDRKIVSAEYLLLCEATGQPWKGDNFRHKFAEVRAAAALEWSTFWYDDASSVGMDDLWFMHLRHTAVTELALAGCTVPEIASITGHTLKSVYNILRRYLVMTSALADRAAAKRLTLDTEIATLVDEAKTAGIGR